MSLRDALLAKADQMELESLRARLAAVEAERDELASEAVDRLMLVASLRTRAEQAEAERERVETFLNATWLTCWAKGVGDVPDREPPTDIEDAARDVSTFILGCNVQISELLAEVARLRGEYARGLREAAGVCEAYFEELDNRTVMERVDDTMVGADELAVDECRHYGSGHDYGYGHGYGYGYGYGTVNNRRD